MRAFISIAVLFAIIPVFASTSGGTVWDELKAKREKLPGYHQEFNLSQEYRAENLTHSFTREVIVDAAPGEWRERSISGVGDFIRIFDGTDLYSMNEGANEYTRKNASKDVLPAPYNFTQPEWAKSVELERRRCPLASSEHMCVLLKVPLQRFVLPGSSPNSGNTQLDGTAQIIIDTETGLIIKSRIDALVQQGMHEYHTTTICELKQMSVGAINAALFKLPSSDMRQVRELPHRSAASIKKALVGKPAPELNVKDMFGNEIALSSLKGKTVLLDFWATWCGPCRADGPSLEKLYRKYGEKDVAVVGISVAEERSIARNSCSSTTTRIPSCSRRKTESRTSIR